MSGGWRGEGALERTLLGAIPALTVSFVSRCTVSRISRTHSSASIKCSSQYAVMLRRARRSEGTGADPGARTHSLEVALVAPGRTHVRVIPPEDVHDAPRHLHVAGEVRLHEDELRAELLRDEGLPNVANELLRETRGRMDDALDIPDRAPNFRAS